MLRLESAPPTELSVFHAQSLNLHCQCLYLVLEFENIDLRGLDKVGGGEGQIYARFGFLHRLVNCLGGKFSEDLHAVVDHLRDLHWLYRRGWPAERVFT